MEFITPQVKITADGSPTLVCPSSGDTYHSVNGALAESMHVYIRNGLEAATGETVAVLEAGLGSGLNAWLTARHAERTGRNVSYTAIELHPVEPSLLSSGRFPDDSVFRAIHRAEWRDRVKINDRFTILKLKADLVETVFDTKFDVVYFDMFAPDTVPHLWTEEVFRNIAGAMDPGAALVTYCAKGDVKRALRAAGFEVHRLPGAPGKRHMLRAVRL